MRLIKQGITVVAVGLLAALAYAQDSQSLGDAARQARQQKQAKEAKGKTEPDAKPVKVITNEQIPEHPELAPKASSSRNRADEPPSFYDGKLSAEQWKSMIQRQEDVVRNQEAELNKLKDSIQFAPGNCVYNCVQWNEAQKQKQDRAERMGAQLEEGRKRLEGMQESARQQGYGSSVYEP
jgi:hypothetical protein